MTFVVVLFTIGLVIIAAALIDAARDGRNAKPAREKDLID